MTYNFALIGAAGFVAPRHLKAIHETGNSLSAAMDPHDSVGILDNFFPSAKFFTEIERFDRYLDKQHRESEDRKIHYISICSPNYLHDAHIRLALRAGAHAVCEKPLVINPWNLDPLAELEEETGCRVYTVLQLRYLESVRKLKKEIEEHSAGDKLDVCLTYITRRGTWYHISWKGSEEKSGGLAMNIGVHFFDLLIWLFGPVEASRLYYRSNDRMSGVLELEKARVRWFLSVDLTDLPGQSRQNGQAAYRSITVDGKELEFSKGFSDLHTSVYHSILNGQGLGISDARPSIDIVYDIRKSDVTPPRDDAHPILKDRR